MPTPFNLAAFEAFVAEDAIAMAEEILDREEMDYDECPAKFGHPLCGSSWCESVGCIVDKRLRSLRLSNLHPHEKVG